MGMTIRVMILLGMLGCIASVSSGIRVNDESGVEAEGVKPVGAGGSQGTVESYDPPYTPTECYGDEDKGVLLAKVSDALWNGGRACGTYYKVRCIKSADKAKPCKAGASVTVLVVDYCADCETLFQISDQAYTKIADPEAPSLKVGYSTVKG